MIFSKKTQHNNLQTSCMLCKIFLYRSSSLMQMKAKQKMINISKIFFSLVHSSSCNIIDMNYDLTNFQFH